MFCSVFIDENMFFCQKLLSDVTGLERYRTCCRNSGKTYEKNIVFGRVIARVIAVT